MGKDASKKGCERREVNESRDKSEGRQEGVESQEVVEPQEGVAREEHGEPQQGIEVEAVEPAVEVEAGAETEMAPETPGHIDEVAPPEEALDPESELKALRDRHLRLAAEFDNFRRRTRRELAEAGEIARAELAGRLLEAMDDLERVANTPADSTTTEALHQGTELVARKFAKTLTDAGMATVNPLGERFDPNNHEAIMMERTDDPAQDEVVSRVILVGYRLAERLLRPAQVGVYRYEDESA